MLWSPNMTNERNMRGEEDWESQEKNWNNI